MTTLTNAKAFKGILQYKSTDKFTKEAGYVYFIREFNENSEETGNAEIYFGNRKYGDVNVSQLSEIENILETKLDSNNLKTINNESLIGDGNIVVGNIIIEEDDSLSVDDVDTNTYVKYVAQTLTDEQKAQARENIGALSQNNIKTINGENIVGSGNLVIEDGTYIWDWDGSDSGTITQDQWDALQSADNILIRNSGIIITLQNLIKTESFISIFIVTLIEKTLHDYHIIINSDLSYQGNLQEHTFIESGGLKTINGNSLEGSGNIEISGGSSSGSNAYSEVSHGTSDTTFTLPPNTFHIWDEVGALTLTLGAETSGVANEYIFQFTSGSEPTTLSLPDDIKWTGGEIPTIEANKIYQISILKGLGSVLEWDNSPTLIENKVTLSISGTKYLVSLQYAAASDIAVQVRTVDGLITVNVLSGEISKTASPLGPLVDSDAYIEAIAPISDNNYNYTW